jgi:capsular polysaccharide biosynthesis protein
MNQASIDMQRNAIDSWQVIRNRIGPIILSFLLIFAVAAIITYIMPRKFRGQVKMKIERDANAVFMDPMASRSDPMMGSEIGAKNEFETLTMAETLYPVVDEFNLAHEWNLPDRRAALGKLVGNLEAQAAVRSDFVTIEFYDESGKRAADIANAVSKAYMERRPHSMPSPSSSPNWSSKALQPVQKCSRPKKMPASWAKPSPPASLGPQVPKPPMLKAHWKACARRKNISSALKSEPTNLISRRCRP